MTDSRAALEEAAEKFWHSIARSPLGNIVPMTTLLADFAEQESSSLKLLLRAMFADQVDYLRWPQPALLFYGEPRKILSFELDSSGIPVITPEIIEALKNAQ